MTSERDRSYVGHIVDSIDLILRYVGGDSAALSEEGAIRDAVVWRLETIGEAAGHLSDELRGRHLEIPRIPHAAARTHSGDRRRTPRTPARGPLGRTLTSLLLRLDTVARPQENAVRQDD